MRFLRLRSRLETNEKHDKPGRLQSFETGRAAARVILWWMRTSCFQHYAFLVLALLTFPLTVPGCGSGESTETAEGAEPASGDEQAPAEAPEAEGESTDAPAEAAAAPAEPDVMQELQPKVIQLGVNRAALERTLEGPQVDCKRAESQRDRICSLTEEICAAAEKTAEAQPQCDNAKTKCDGAKADVKEVRCKG